MLHKALHDAVRWSYLPRNVAEFSDPPKQTSSGRSTRTWTPEELRNFFGRAAWFFSVTPTRAGKGPHELVFDADSGAILCMRTDNFYLGFEELDVDETIPNETFRWDGPVEPRKIGRALVIPEDDGSHSVTWEVSVHGRPMFDLQGPGGSSRDEAVAWGEERAANTVVRGE